MKFRLNLYSFHAGIMWLFVLSCPVPPTSSAVRCDLWWCHSRWTSPAGLSPCQHTKMWRTAHSTWGQRLLQAGSMLQHNVNEESRQFWLGTVLWVWASYEHRWQYQHSHYAHLQLVGLTCTDSVDLYFSLITLQLCLLSLYESQSSHSLNILCFPNLSVGYCTDSTLSKYSPKEKALYPLI